MSDCASADSGYIYDSVHPAILVKLQNITVSCKGYGLKIEDHPYDRSAFRYLPLLEPLWGKSNRILKSQSVVELQPLKWWKAQCASEVLTLPGELSWSSNHDYGLRH
jgi:hypothetical protein